MANLAPWLTRARLATAEALYPQYARELWDLEAHFNGRPLLTIIHVVGGGIFLSLGLLQFSPRIRRNLRFHRRSGYFLVVLAVLAGVTGVWLGIVAPFSSGERLPSAAAGAVFLIAPGLAIAAIRRGDVARHRDWMIRFFAVGIGIVVIRLVLPVMIWLTNPATLREVIGSAFWAGWLVSLVAAEVWIRTRRREAAQFAAPVG